MSSETIENDKRNAATRLVLNAICKFLEKKQNGSVTAHFADGQLKMIDERTTTRLK